MALDDLDRQIIGALIEDARATYAEIGAQVGLSAPAVKRRVDRLRIARAITGFSARVDPAALGWATAADVEWFCRGRASPPDIPAPGARAPPPGMSPYSPNGCAVAPARRGVPGGRPPGSIQPERLRGGAGTAQAART